MDFKLNDLKRKQFYSFLLSFKPYLIPVGFILILFFVVRFLMLWDLNNTASYLINYCSL